jgi:hypothetical protein
VPPFPGHSAVPIFPPDAHPSRYSQRHPSRNDVPVTDTIRVFINMTMLELPAGAVVEDAVRAYDPGLEAGLASGAVLLTDGRGIELDRGSRLASGAILRVIERARRGDAHS